MRRVALLLMFMSTVALAHDHDRPELNGWFKGLKSNVGPCCDGSDAMSLDDPDWEAVNNHYRVRIEGEWYDVPEGAVVQGENKAGMAMVWPYREWSAQHGSWKIRCFMPGILG